MILHKNPTPFLEVCFPDQQERFIVSPVTTRSPDDQPRPSSSHVALRLLQAHNLLSLMNHLGPVDPKAAPVPSSAEPQTFSHVFPMLDLHLFLTSRTVGGSIANDSLSYAFLAVGAVQISYLHHQSSIRYASDRNAAAAAASGDNNRKYTLLANSLFNASVAIMRTAASLLEVKGDEPEDAVLDTLNAAASLAILSRCLGGGQGYQEALLMAKTLIGVGGGPRRMLMYVGTGAWSSFLSPPGRPAAHVVSWWPSSAEPQSPATIRIG